MNKTNISFSILLFFCINATGQVPSALDAYDSLRIKWKNILTGANTSYSEKYVDAKVAYITKDAQANWDKLEKHTDRAFLWQDLASTTISAEITYAYRRIYTMALAYNLPSSYLKGDKILRDDIVNALIWMDKNRYVKQYNDWWDFQIGSPLELNNCICLMHDDLSKEQRILLNNKVDRLTGNPTTDMGANRAWRGFVYALNGILKHDASKIVIARNALSAIFEYAKKGEGFFTDGSFIQHSNHPYNLGYGIDALDKITDLMNLLNHSQWQISDPQSTNLYKWIQDAYQPFIFKGIAMDMVRGREMARYYNEDYKAGFRTMGIIAKVALFAPSIYANDYKSMVKYWVTANKHQNFFAYATTAQNIPINSIVQVQAIFNNNSIRPKAPSIFYKQFPMIDRALKVGAGFTFGISMHSTRIANFEADIKNENKNGWHTGDGMTYLYNADITQFSGNFWPTVDNYRLPGTTVLKNTPISNDKVSDRDWVGGVSLESKYGTTGMDYHAYGYQLQAKKSWFMFDNEVVALGAGISGIDNKPVETIIENRKLDKSIGKNIFTINGFANNSNQEWGETTMPNVKFAHLSSTQQGADIGYYFPIATTIQTIKEYRTANWNTINGNPAISDTVNHTNQFLTAWLNHGINPIAGTYAYVLLPGLTAKQVSDYANHPQIKILKNDTLVQAVKESNLKIIGANFWTDTPQSVDIITCNKKAAVMIREINNEIELSIADPTMLNTGNITLIIGKAATALISNDKNITVVQLRPKIIVNVDVNEAKGSSFKARFKF